ncbi:SDR family oxidoreductase [Leeuwenhoekiella aequorea]|uniref:UDP-N-acetylglucosamine 4-epimerase n=1 Tax=Leeuwenhoekiella aequorea TaxID=283736 RepID=A0A4Q0P440_9FLAO|nr:SDR family oxidoreductase [Leeuwenhoekiella aequorea]RXG20838.1 UDP-N-acetylglucosamine 4-epimerase [Leeuwenhoekiella aequorea]
MNILESFDFKNKVILVTGGAGFIGSHLIDKLLQLGAKVRCLDNFSTGKFKNIQDFEFNPNFQLIEGDIRNYDICLEATQGCDWVSHQAALGSVPRSIKDPLTTHAVNITGFLNIIEASRIAEIKNFVYAASSSTYGNSQALPKIESEIGEPLSPYALTKLVNENYASVYKKTYDFNSIGLRYFNVFGPKQDINGAYAAVIPKFVEALLNHKSPTINGDGSFSRDYTFIENVVQANLLALTATSECVLNETYNVACAERTSLIELLNLLKHRLINYDDKVIDLQPNFGPEREGDVPHSLASITKAHNLLAYNPEYSLEKGLDLTVDWYVKNLKS